MTHAALAPRIGRDFDPFLFASIGQDRHGQALSVISALARSDLDPWREAVDLSRMSRGAAAARLSQLIADLPGEPAPVRPVDAIAGDLIKLLPGNSPIAPPLPPKFAKAVASASPDARLWMGLGAVAVLLAVGMGISALLPANTVHGAHGEPPVAQNPVAPVVGDAPARH